jgi:hypothetical protein
MAPAYLTIEWGDPADFIEGEGAFTMVDIGFEATDPRASGLFTITDATRHIDHGGEGFDVVAQSVRLVNDGGTWTGTAEGVGASEPGGATTLWRLDGAGDYEGLSLFLVSNLADETWGVIVPSDVVPVPPDMPSTE